MKYTSVCGEVIDIIDDKVKKLNAELVVTEQGAPAIVLQDWTGEGKDLVVLHIKEAVQLKAVIDNLILDATLFNKGYVEELMDDEDEDETS